MAVGIEDYAIIGDCKNGGSSRLPRLDRLAVLATFRFTRMLCRSDRVG
jgi:hypothetical protein